MAAQKTTSRPVWANRQEAAEYIGVAAKTLANWKSLGQGPKCDGPDRIPRYRYSELDRWLTSNT